MPAAAVVILNPDSGGSPEPDEAARWFDRLRMETRILRPPSGADIAALASRAVAEGAPAVVAAGGDGTVSAVASALANTGVPMGVLPVGTLNHFAQDAGLPLEPAEAASVIAGGHTMPVDLGEVNGRIFVNNSSLGLYPIFVKHRKAKQRMGYKRWPAFVSAALTAFRRFPFLTLRLVVDRRELIRRTPLLFIGNNRYELEGFDIGKRSSLAEGQLCVHATHRAGRLDLLRLSLLALLGRLQREPKFDLLCVREFSVEARRKRIPVALDGEVMLMESPLRYRVLPGALRLLVP